ncbi:MAG TPA: type II toxin-antitoxin system VapC family toxin [Silvibacterium sp.]|nr:type II toxin-antitoxin system VapC family toxin [Silvibacterium sp.]
MKHYVLDANAVLRYLMGADGGEKIRSLVLNAEQGTTHLSMSVINLGEALYVLLKSFEEGRALQMIRELRQVISIADADVERTVQASILKYRYKLGYADSFAAALAIEYNATLVSADPAFEKLERKLKWMKLPRFRG